LKETVSWAVDDGMNQQVVHFLETLMMVMINMCYSTRTVIEAVEG